MGRDLCAAASHPGRRHPYSILRSGDRCRGYLKIRATSFAGASMTTAITMQPTAAAAPTVEGSQRDWFLKDSKWEDARWVFAPTNLLEEEARLKIIWDFKLPSGRRFTDPSHTSLLETTKRLIATVRSRSLVTGLPHRARTAIDHFFAVRPLIIWMDSEGYSRFEQLDIEAIL